MRRNILDDLKEYELYKHDIPVILLDGREIADGSQCGPVAAVGMEADRAVVGDQGSFPLDETVISSSRKARDSRRSLLPLIFPLERIAARPN